MKYSLLISLIFFSFQNILCVEEDDKKQAWLDCLEDTDGDGVLSTDEYLEKEKDYKNLRKMRRCYKERGAGDDLLADFDSAQKKLKGEKMEYCLGVAYENSEGKFKIEGLKKNNHEGSGGFKSCFNNLTQNELHSIINNPTRINGLYKDALTAMNHKQPDDSSFTLDGPLKNMALHFFNSHSGRDSHVKNKQWCRDNAPIIGRQLVNCVAAMATMNYGVDEYPDRYHNSENFKSILSKGDTKDVKGMMNNQAMAQMQQAGGQAALIQQLAQQNEVLSCQSTGVETLDFDLCKTGVHTYNVYMLGGLGVEAAHTIKGQSDLADADSDLREGQDALDPTAQFKYQKQNLKNQAQIQNQKAAFQLSKLAVFSGFAMNMPDQATVIEHCANTLKNEGSTDTDIQQYCQEVHSEFAFIMNDKASQQMATIAAIAGKDGIVHGGNAAVLNKRARDMDDIIDNIEDYKAPDYSINDPDVLTTRCRANPLLPECQGDQIVSRDGGMNFDIGGSDPGNTTVQANQGDESTPAGADTAFTGDESTELLDDPFNGVAAPTHKPTGLADKVAVGEKRAGPGGASGDGGGGANASASGLGRSNIGPSDAGKPRVAPDQESSVKYGAPGKGSLSYSSGRGLNRKKSKKGNPLEGLLGKKKLGKKDRVMSFRSPAAINSKNGKSLFDLIKNAYDRAEKSNKLIVYKAVN